MFRTNFPTIVFYLRKTSFQCYEALCIPNASRVINNRGMRQTPRKGGKTIVPRSCRASEKHAFSKKCARKSIDRGRACYQHRPGNHLSRALHRKRGLIVVIRQWRYRTRPRHAPRCTLSTLISLRVYHSHA